MNNLAKQVVDDEGELVLKEKRRWHLLRHVLVIRLRRWFEIREAKRLYSRIWKANSIILQERHGAILKKQNKKYWQDLEECADVLSRAAYKVNKSYEDK